MTTPLYLIRFVLDRRAVLRVGAQQRLGQVVDDGALLHAGLSSLFAASSDRSVIPLSCFAVDDVGAAARAQPESLFVLAYSDFGAEQIEARMGPDRSTLLRHFDSKKMPDFVAGQRLGFRTRCCPVVRTKLPGEDVGEEPVGRRTSRELDAFLHATLSAGVGVSVDREEVYRTWLNGQLERDGRCRVEQSWLVEYRHEGMRRGRGPRIERPNAILEGTLTVAVPEAFGHVLRRGVGRHRAYGFGMLLLKAPPG